MWKFSKITRTFMEIIVMENKRQVFVARKEDLGRLMEIFEAAKRFMRANGNATQWNGAYPSEELILKEIREGHCFIVMEEKRIIGTFCFIIGEDPTYNVIHDGAWLDDAPYGTIHRIASDGSSRGVGHTCVEFCSSLVGTLRADTHEDNRPMRNLLEKEGFVRCGIIFIADGSPRIAFQRINRTPCRKRPSSLVSPGFSEENISGNCLEYKTTSE